MVNKKDDKKSKKKAEKPEKSKVDKAVERMKTVPKAASGPRMISVKLIYPNPYNCNRMNPEELGALTADMKSMKHPSTIDPIRVRKDGKKFEIIDGEHRFTIAKKLGWKEIHCVVFDMPQDDAMLWNFRINRQRGTHDPLKEAHFFHHLVEDMGLTQTQTGQLLNVDRSVIGRRISILKIDDELSEYIDWETTPVSVLEVIAQAPTPEFQDELLKDHNLYGNTVEDLQDKVNEEKKEIADREAFQKMIEKAKFPDCPNCGKRATAYWYTKPYVLHEQYGRHIWNPKTGLSKQKEDNAQRAKETGHPNQARVLSVFRHTMAPSEIIAGARKNFADFAETVFHDLSNFSLTFEPKTEPGDYDGDFTAELTDGRWGNAEIKIESDQGELHVVLEPKAYGSGEKTKVIVSYPSPYDKGGMEKAEKLLSMFIEGKLTFKKLAKKVSKKKKLKLPKILSYLVQPTDKEVYELEAKEVYKSLARFCNNGKHGKCSIAQDALLCPGYNCPDCLVKEVLREEKIWGTKIMGDPKYVNDYKGPQPPADSDGILTTAVKLFLFEQFRKLLESGFKNKNAIGGSMPVVTHGSKYIISISLSDESKKKPPKKPTTPEPKTRTSKTEPTPPYRPGGESAVSHPSHTAKRTKENDDAALRRIDALQKCSDYEDTKYCNRCVNGTKTKKKACFVEPKKGKKEDYRIFGVITVCPNCDHEFESAKGTKHPKCPKCGKGVN